MKPCSIAVGDTFYRDLCGRRVVKGLFPRKEPTQVTFVIEWPGAEISGSRHTRNLKDFFSWADGKLSAEQNL